MQTRLQLLGCSGRFPEFLDLAHKVGLFWLFGFGLGGFLGCLGGCFFGHGFFGAFLGFLVEKFDVILGFWVFLLGRFYGGF